MERESEQKAVRERRRRLETIVDPDALEILTSLALEPATSAELGERLGLEIEVVRRHLRRLSDLERVVAARVRRRSRFENQYRVDPRATVLDPADLVGLSRDPVAAAELSLLRTMYREASAASDSGSFERRVDSSLVRLMLPADDRGFSRALDLHRRLLDEVIAEAERAGARIDQDGGKAIATSVQILCFEHPIERWLSLSDRATVRRKPEAVSVERLFEYLSDPLRGSIVDLLSVRRASAAGLADLLGTPTERVRYELDRLLAEGVVRVVGTKPSRGTVGRVFEADPGRLTVSTRELERLDVGLPDDWDGLLLRRIFGAALAAIGACEATERGGLYIARVVAPIDARGFARIGELNERAIADLSRLREEGLDAGDGGVPPDHVLLSGLLAFERVPTPKRRATEL